MSSRREFFGGDSQVHEIKSGEFCEFISDRDVAMIMFYVPCGVASAEARVHFGNAPALTDRPNVAYGAVNCDIEKNICFKEKAFDCPVFKAYSRGMMISEYEDIYSITGSRLAKFVDELPIPVNSSTPAPQRRRY